MASKRKPTAKQLRARRKFAAMARRRAREARAAKRAANRAGKQRNVTRRPQSKTTASRVNSQAKRSRSGSRKKSRNIEMGYRDGTGFHPIRVSRDYDGRRTGEKRIGTPLERATAGLRKRGYVRGKPTRNRCRNQAPPGIQDLHKAFLGRPAVRTYTDDAPAGTPSHVAQLGKLVEVKTDKEVFQFEDGEAALAADANGNLYITGNVVVEPLADFGSLRSISYAATKNHLGGGDVEYVHRFGDEGGNRPRLKSDADGALRIVGGSYTIAPEGIRN